MPSHSSSIAERIAQTLERHGLEVALRPADQAGAVERYDAFVVGSAAYMGTWLEAATHFVDQHRRLLASSPVWLFSSGPVGTERVDPKGRDVVEASVPREFARFTTEIHPRDERVFFGAYDPEAEPVGLMERVGSFFTRMPAIRQSLPAGDFRDWPAIESWAEAIAGQLTGRELAAANASPITRTNWRARRPPPRGPPGRSEPTVGGCHRAWSSGCFLNQAIRPMQSGRIAPADRRHQADACCGPSRTVRRLSCQSSTPQVRAAHRVSGSDVDGRPYLPPG